MREHYNIDRLIEHGCEPIPETTRVVNPHWRALDAQVRHHNAKLNRELASFASASLPADPQPEDVSKWEHKKGTLQKAIEQRRQKIETLKSERKALSKHIALKDLPEQDWSERGESRGGPQDGIGLYRRGTGSAGAEAAAGKAHA